MSAITKTIDHREYTLFEGGHTKVEAKRRVQKSLRVMRQNKHRGGGSSVRTVPYEGRFAVFISNCKPTGRQ